MVLKKQDYYNNIIAHNGIAIGTIVRIVFILVGSNHGL